jgi:hypothetical protein
LTDGQPITMPLAAPFNVAAIRVIGTPACGDNRAQAFASCAEIEAR